MRRPWLRREEPLGLGFVVVERGEVRGHVGLLEVVRRPLPLGALVDARRR